ncbi:hypothetical protein D3C87_190350 [compost metagenome]
MDRRLIYKCLVSILLLQSSSIVHAEMLEAMAEKGKSGSTLPAPPSAPAPPTRPAPPAQSQYEGIGRVENITRRIGGEIYRFDLVKAIPLTRLDAKSKMGRVKIIAATLLTDKNERIPVRNLVTDSLLPKDPALVSENLTSNAAILAIEIHAEAMGGIANLDIKAVSNREAPRLTLRGSMPVSSCKTNIDGTLKAKLDPIQLWASRAEGSAPDSIQEKFAGTQLNKYVNEFVATLRSNNSYSSTTYVLTLLNFFTERYNASRAGGPTEASYKTMTTETYNILLGAIQNEIPCRKFTTEDLMNIAVDFNKRHDAAGEGTRAAGIYETMMNRIRDFAPLQYRKELATKNLNFRQADTEGTKYYKLFMSDTGEGFLKATHRDMSAYAYAVAEQALVREVKQMDIEQKYQLIVEYQAKYNENTADFPRTTALRYLTILSQQVNFVIYLNP